MQAMRELLASLSEQSLSSDRLLLVTAPVLSEHGSAALLWTQLSLPLLRFAPPAERGTGLPASGLGEAVRITGDGPLALETVREAADALFARMVNKSHPSCLLLPAPRLYGCFRFELGLPPTLLHPEPAHDPWQSFATASFVLPRWLLLQTPSQLLLQLAIPASERTHLAAVYQELAAIEDALLRPMDDVVGSQSPAKLVVCDELPADSYCAMIEKALTEIAAQRVQKVVPARRSYLRLDRRLQPQQILCALDDSYPQCNRFAYTRDESTLLGATPELLVGRSGRRVRTEALAGTRARTKDSDDEKLGQSLLQDDKERREHDHVIAAIVDSLHSCGVRDVQVDATGLRLLRNVMHLCTPIQGQLAHPQHVLDLVAALHPTPAVCGLPREAAAHFLAQTEPVSRGGYAAPVGYFDADGCGEFWVALRSALIRAEEAWLYAGAGVVAGSDPATEYAETEAKLRAMRSVIGGVA